jgi:hypothetical protein
VECSTPCRHTRFISATSEPQKVVRADEMRHRAGLDRLPQRPAGDLDAVLDRAASRRHLEVAEVRRLNDPGEAMVSWDGYRASWCAAPCVPAMPHLRLTSRGHWIADSPSRRRVRPLRRPRRARGPHLVDPAVRDGAGENRGGSGWSRRHGCGRRCVGLVTADACDDRYGCHGRCHGGRDPGLNRVLVDVSADVAGRRGEPAEGQQRREPTPAGFECGGEIRARRTAEEVRSRTQAPLSVPVGERGTAAPSDSVWWAGQRAAA